MSRGARPISRWGAPEELKSGIDAAFESKGEIYFMKGNDYWQYRTTGVRKVSQGCVTSLGSVNGGGGLGGDIVSSGGFGGGYGGNINGGGFGSGSSGGYGGSSGSSGGFGGGYGGNINSGSGSSGGVAGGFGGNINSGSGNVGFATTNVCGWPGLPIAATKAALEYSNGRLYFFTGDGKYYRWNDETNTVDTNAKPAYPRDVRTWWLGCD